MHVVFVFALFLLTQCSKPTTVQKPDSPGSVDVKSVNSILTLQGEPEKCRAAIEAQGGKVLYDNGNGLLFSDLKLDGEKLRGCEAAAVPNEKITLERPTENGSDLETLLRLIPAEEIGARSFVKDHPTFDGRGVTIAILDTGVEVDHPMLKTTPQGENKIIDFNDFSGEGRVQLTAVKKAEDGTLEGPEGLKYQGKTLAGENFHLGIFKGSSLVEAENLAAQDEFSDLGVVVYSAGGRNGLVRIDTNDDKSFDDEAELTHYARSQKIVKIGKKRSLTVSVNVPAVGKSVNLCFDDGSHGTHVAGIAAGYDPKGLQGVAPGAKIVGVKIGDNRLSGGSTTTASMLLAIDYAVQQKAQVLNLSYGIRAGSNLGQSAIDKYIDKVAREKNVLFSISAGNEGPGLLTIGTPAGASLAITNAAYVSKNTAQENYGYIGVEDNNTWFFSSVGPLFDGGWKPTLLAPGSALSSVPLWDKNYANYRGTSMASPEVTGGLALILSAAQQSSLSTDRAAVTKAVYGSAVEQKNLMWIEQGHGLMNVPGAFELLGKLNKDTARVEYTIAVRNPALPNGTGKGVFLRTSKSSSRVFDVTVSPQSAPQGVIQTFRLVASADWISVPPTLWTNGTPKAFQIKVGEAVFEKAGLYSAKVSAYSESTGELAFDVPVTIISPRRLPEEGKEKATLRVGQTQRFFYEVAAGTTGIALSVKSEGAMVWGQLLDSEGRKVIDCRPADSALPMASLRCVGSLQRTGVYELDWVAPATNPASANIDFEVQPLSLTSRLEGVKPNGDLNLVIENNFGSLRFTPKVSLRAHTQKKAITIQGNGTQVPFTVTEEDAKQYSSILFTVKTSKEYYDLMTDYPYRVYDKENNRLGSGGLELNSSFEVGSLSDIAKGEGRIDIQGAFTKDAPASWAIQLTEERILKEPLTLYTGNSMVLDAGGAATLSVPVGKRAKAGDCLTLSFTDGTGQLLQESLFCL